jgi:hypothetical protein
LKSSIIVSELILAAIFIAEKDLSVVAVEAERVMKKELSFLNFIFNFMMQINKSTNNNYKSTSTNRTTHHVLSSSINNNINEIELVIIQQHILNKKI